MGKYEVVYIIHPDLEGSIEKITEKVKETVSKLSGSVSKEESWGKKKLAYEIKKNNFGIYQYLEVEMPAKEVSELERNLRLSEEVIRFLVSAKEEARVVKRVKKAVAKPEKKVEKEIEKPKAKAATKKSEKSEKERLEALDEKLNEIIRPEGEK